MLGPTFAPIFLVVSPDCRLKNMTTPISLNPVLGQKLSRRQKQSALGALVGAAVGDALGAPFEFKPAGSYSNVFPNPLVGGSGEMTGGGSFNWAPGEFTDDTQMALALAESLIACGLTFKPEHVWMYFRSWAERSTDIGITTQASLKGSDYKTAAREAHDRLKQSGGNGSVMRISPIGIAGVGWGHAKTVEVARQQSGLTHFDEGAGWGAAIVAELIRRLIICGSLEDSMNGILDFVPSPHHETYKGLLAESWVPSQNKTLSNGTVWICIAQAIWAVRNTTSFESALVSAIDLGDDADTVGAVTGALAGALYGIQQIPSRWTTYINGRLTLPNGETRTYRGADLQDISRQLVGLQVRPETPVETPIQPKLIHELGIYAANLNGAESAGESVAIVSLCRTEDRFIKHLNRRETFMIDKVGQNPFLFSAVDDAVNSIEAFLNDGQEVLVHCHGGRSRTGLVLKAWYMRRFQKSSAEADSWLTKIWPHYASSNQDFTDFLEVQWH